MNATISKLASITDAGLFERIASAALRYAEPEIYKNLSHQGVNPDGKTIKAPLDNVGWVSADETNMLVAAAHTTTKRDELEKKWLHDLSLVKPRKNGAEPTGVDGDLIKAIKEIQKIRKQYPDLKARLALMCNCEEHLEVRIKAEALASANNIELDIWSVSRLGEFLDTNPDGQAIRHNYFGTLPTRISYLELLKIGEASLGSLEFDESSYVDRKNFSSDQHTFVVGVSGIGKTTACINKLKKYLGNSFPVLRISEESVKIALTVEEAIDIELKRYSPALLPDAGLEALKLCSAQIPLLVLIEDINRSTDSLHLLRKLIQWTQTENRKWCLYCPVWPRLMASLDVNEKEYLEKNYNIFYLDIYTEEEAIAAICKRALIKEKTLDELSAQTIVKQLGYDPLLISIYDIFNSVEEENDIIGTYITSTLEKIANLNSCYQDDLEDAIDEYAIALFKNKTLQSTTRNLKLLVTEKTRNTLKFLFNDATLLRLVLQGKENFITARHDRINFYIIARALSNCLKIDKTLDLSDPYFAEIIGLACILGEFDEQNLHEIGMGNILVPFYAYQYAIKIKKIYIEKILNVIKQCFSLVEYSTFHFARQRYASLTILNEVVHPTINQILTLYPESDRYELYHQIAFKNGSLSAAVNWLILCGFEYEFPGRKQIIDFVFSKYKETIISRICELLSSTQTSVQFKHGLLYLIGYTEHQEFADAVREAWKLMPIKSRDARIFFWAGARVCDNEPDSLLGPIFDYWQDLSEEKDQHQRSEKNSFALYSLDLKFKDYTPNHSISYILGQVKQRKDLYYLIIYMLREVDHPAVVEAYAQYLADISRKGGLTFGLVLDELRRNSKNNRSLSALSKHRLLTISENKENDNFLREKAFDLWEASPDFNDLNILLNIKKEDVRYDRAIWGRARRKDFTVIDPLIEKINENPRYWWQCSRYIWHEKLVKLLEDRLRNINEKSNEDDFWIFPEIFEKLTQYQAENLLIKYWDNISYNSDFIKIALFVATPQLCKLVLDKVQRENEPSKLFHFFSIRMGVVKHEGRLGIKRYEQMEAIQPYLSYLRDSDLCYLSESCLKNGWRYYSDKYIKPLLKEEGFKRYIEVDTSHLASDLEAGKISFSDLWIEDRMREGWSKEDATDALFTWFYNHQTEKAMEILGRILSQSGNRKDFIRLISLNLEFPNSRTIIDQTKFSIYRRTLE